MVYAARRYSRSASGITPEAGTFRGADGVLPGNRAFLEADTARTFKFDRARCRLNQIKTATLENVSQLPRGRQMELQKLSCTKSETAGIKRLALLFFKIGPENATVIGVFLKRCEQKINSRNVRDAISSSDN